MREALTKNSKRIKEDLQKNLQNKEYIEEQLKNMQRKHREEITRTLRRIKEQLETT